MDNNDDLKNPANQLTPEAIDHRRLQDRLKLVRTFMFVALGTIVATFVISLFSTSGPSTMFITFFSGSAFLAMLLLLNEQRLQVITLIVGISSSLAILLGTHLSGGVGGPNATLMGTMVITFLVLYEGRVFLAACILLLVGYIGLGLLEVTGVWPIPLLAADDNSRIITAAYAVVTIVFGGGFLFWYVTRYVNITRSSIEQARQLSNLNQHFVVQQHVRSQVASDVTIAAQRIGEAVTIQAMSAQETAATVSQVSASAEQLDLEAKLIAGSAQQVSELAGQAAEEVQSSQRLIEQVAQAVQLVHTDVTLAVERTTKLGEHVREITTILQLLESITKETHILSLNAAIEAASAEDSVAGRRFAIVAQEVEELASRAERAASQVRVIINQIEQASNATAMATIESMSETERSVKMLEQATTVAHRLSAMTSDVNIWAESILQSTAQQQSSSEQVASALHQIASLARQNANSERQLQAVAQQLTTLVAHLQPDANEDAVITDPRQDGSSLTPPSSRPTTRLQPAA